MRFKCIRSESYGIVGYDDDRRDGLVGETISRYRPSDYMTAVKIEVPYRRRTHQ
ncbi:uncharacterized protein STEHIDRAFT_125274 [Stereum hirsutum FP-91666 SS1]|uniref:uncharacterized protein n=1 Tax=Stereum hirsutum (strain FP-91666) TaxID=721885 RepID=UPI0004449849|nr:uncharacterized protein STEHIDRAFT_125274 [Stereum hirsutum FP-91666 SS1]EIM80955.1 hypothetical protein STEHIDRAFT_125274 [Stereum hirsutum FP-91666 SS1]